MDDDLPIEPSLSGWHLSLQRVAAWMTRGNRVLDPGRQSSSARKAQRARNPGPSRQQLPPRP